MSISTESFHKLNAISEPQISRAGSKQSNDIINNI